MQEIKNSSMGIFLDTNKQYSTKTQGIDYQMIGGYASVFDVVDSHKDIIKKGAFSNSTQYFSTKKTLPLLWQHRSDKPIGMIETLIEDEYGLYIKAKVLTTTSSGLEAYQLIKSQIITNLSIGYTPIKHHMDYENDTRILEEIDLWEISVVTFSANNHSCITAIF